jgi:hypothetical protein
VDELEHWPFGGVLMPWLLTLKYTNRMPVVHDNKTGKCLKTVDSGLSGRHPNPVQNSGDKILSLIKLRWIVRSS